MTDSTSDESMEWPVRPFLLAAIGMLAAVAVQLLARPELGVDWLAARTALGWGIGAAALTFGFGAERVRLGWVIAFSLVAALLLMGIVYWNGPGGDRAFYWWGWPTSSLCLGIAIAVPLFQTARDEGALRFPYARLHSHAWTNAVLWLACWLFVGVTFLLAWLLATLFMLIKLDFLRELLNKDWFVAALVGGAFGASLGMLRERDGVLRLLQRVVTAVLSVLAPVLAIGLIVFLVALPLMGAGQILARNSGLMGTALACLFGGVVLVNAVIGNGEGDGARNRILRASALILALTTLPLAGLAAIGLTREVQDGGWTPGALWLLVVTVLATAYGVAYLLAVIIGRAHWDGRVRAANFHIALATVVIAIILATPLSGFNAIAAGDQVARLTSGKVSTDRFDWSGLAFDYGAPGRVALARLKQSKDPAIAVRAGRALAGKTRYDIYGSANEQAVLPLAKRLRILPAVVPLPRSLTDVLGTFTACGNGDGSCTVIYRPGERTAIAMRDGCLGALNANSDDRGFFAGGGNCPALLEEGPDQHWRVAQAQPAKFDAATRARLRAALAARQVEVRSVQRRQVFVGGIPVGDAFE